MAPALTPGRKKREDNYFNVGVQGRKTGVTLPDKGVRDEHGLEPIDGIFSSPEKSPAKRAPRPTNGTVTTSEDMDVTSSAPEPTDLLNGRRLVKNSKIHFPPPMARSPMKTNLGSSPRRQSSVGPMSQSRRATMTPPRAASHPAHVDYEVDDIVDTVEQSPLRNAMNARTNGNNRKSVFDFDDDSPVGIARRTRTLIERMEEETEAELAESIIVHQEEETLPAIEDESMQLPQIEEEDPINGHEDAPESSQFVEKPAPKKRGRKRKEPEPDTQQDATLDQADNAEPSAITVEDSTVTEVQQAQAPQRRGRGRPPKGGKLPSLQQPPKQSNVMTDSFDDTLAEEPSANIEMPPPPKPRGRPKRTAPSAPDPEPETLETPEPEPELATLDDTVEDTITADEPAEERPSKRARRTADDPGEGSSKKGRGKGKEKQTTKAKPVKAAPKPKLPPPASSARGRRDPTLSPSKRTFDLQIARHMTPAVDDFYRSQRGRTVYQPLAFWKRERAVFDKEGGVKDVIRYDEVELPKPTVNRTSKKKRRRPLHAIEEEDEDDIEEYEQWEVEDGRMAGYVAKYDPVLNADTGEEQAMEIGYASQAIDRQSKDLAGSMGRFAKLITNNFFGAGMVTLPPGGFKKTKNSRRMHMVFFVYTGKVKVEVGDNSFSISKGGVWQVPRGNWYSITNETETGKLAKIFFAQGCQWDGKEPESA